MVLVEPGTYGSSYKIEQAASHSSRSNAHSRVPLSKLPGKPAVPASERFIRSRGLEAGKTKWEKGMTLTGLTRLVTSSWSFWSLEPIPSS